MHTASPPPPTGHTAPASEGHSTVLTTTRTRPTTTHRHHLTPLQQATLDTALHRAELAADHMDIDGIKTAHAIAATALGLHLPHGAELAQCECAPCPDGCDLIADRASMAEYLAGGLQYLQCAPCAADHRHHGDA